MTVYLDVFFALNTAINYGLLRVSAGLTGAPIRRARFLAAAVLGGAYAAAALVPKLAFLGEPVMKLAALAAMLLMAFGAERRTVRLGAVFLLVSFAFGGAVLFAVQATGAGVLRLPGRSYYPVSAAALLLLGALCWLVCSILLTASMEHGRGEVVPLRLRILDTERQVCALRDTGNTLKDPVTNEQVYVLRWQVLAQALEAEKLSREDFSQPAALLIRLSPRYPALHLRLIPYSTVGTPSSLLLAARCTLRTDKGTVQPILAAFSPTMIGQGQNFDAIMGG